jgi:hypothetical protein
MTTDRSPDAPQLPWSPAEATGVGSLPGTDAREAANIVTGELPGFVHLPELPARGPGADLIGRTGALLSAVDEGFGFETTPGGWRVSHGIGRTMRRAQSWLAQDLDALEEHTQGFAGPLKVQITGPWTMAASVELASGERMLRDPGACRDLADGLAAAAFEHLADLRRRFPRAHLLVQWDEPGLNAVLAGSIGTASGLSRYRAVEPAVVDRGLRAVLGAVVSDGAIAGVHCCAADPPIALMRSAGAQFLSIDLRGAVNDEQLGAAWEGGIGILAGTVPSIGVGRISDSEASRPLREASERLGLADPVHLRTVAVTPTCGLAGASPAWVRTAYAACHAVGRVLRQDALDEGRDER